MLSTTGELDLALGQSEQGVVLATTHVLTGVDVGAALTDENLAGLHELTVETLGAETLTAGVAAVTGGTKTFLCAMSDTYSLQFLGGVTPLREQRRPRQRPSWRGK